MLRGFSREHGINHFAGLRPRHHASELTEQRICLLLPPTRLNHLFQQMDDLPFSVTPSHYQVVQEYLPVSHQLRFSASP